MTRDLTASFDDDAYVLPDAITGRLLSPALVVHLDRVRSNVARVIELAGGVERWRPHVKTTKIPAVWAELVRAGVTRFKCATTRELDWLLRAARDEGLEAPDVILAYPLVGPALERLAQVARGAPDARVSVLCEAPEAVDHVPDGVSIFVDVNPGMDRTGVPLAERDTILEVARRAGKRFRGVHFYDGHHHQPDRAERERTAFAAYAELLELVERLREDGSAVEELVTSGTPAFPCALAFDGFAPTADVVHRISPGTVVFHDLRSEEQNPGLGLVPAALVHARVVSHPRADLATCDAGSKSIAAEAGDPCAAVLGRPDLVAQAPSEEHLPLLVTDPARKPERGELLRLVPRHVCPTVNLAEEALLVDEGEVRAVPVSARAHELLLP